MPTHATNTNVRNAPENIVRMERGKIVTHYTILWVGGGAIIALLFGSSQIDSVCAEK